MPVGAAAGFGAVWFPEDAENKETKVSFTFFLILNHKISLKIPFHTFWLV